jgi:hypothetical protein
MGTDADSMVRVIPCDDHSSGFRVGLPFVGGFESKRLVPNHRTEALSLSHIIPRIHYTLCISVTRIALGLARLGRR